MRYSALNSCSNRAVFVAKIVIFLANLAGIDTRTEVEIERRLAGVARTEYVHRAMWPTTL